MHNWPKLFSITKIGKSSLLFVLFGFGIITLLSVVVSLSLMAIGGLSLLKGVSIYVTEAAEDNSADCLDKCIKGVEFMLLMPLPIFILKGISFYVQDLLETGRVARQTKGVFLHIKILIAGLLIGVISAVLASEAIGMTLTYGKVALGIPLFLGLVFVYKSLDSAGGEFHRARDIALTKLEDKDKNKKEREDSKPIYSANLWIDDQNLDDLVRRFSAHSVANKLMNFTWVIGIFLSGSLGIILGLVGLWEIIQGGREALAGKGDDEAYKAAMASGISGLEFLLLSPLAVFVVDGVRKYFSDLTADGHISRASRDGLLEVKVLLTGLLLSVVATETVGLIIRGFEVAPPLLEVITSKTIESEDFFTTRHSIILVDYYAESDEATASNVVRFENAICNFLVLLVLSFYYLKLVRHGAMDRSPKLKGNLTNKSTPHE